MKLNQIVFFLSVSLVGSTILSHDKVTIGQIQLSGSANTLTIDASSVVFNGAVTAQSLKLSGTRSGTLAVKADGTVYVQASPGDLIIPALTSASTTSADGEYSVVATSTFENHAAWLAFDDDYDTYWTGGNGTESSYNSTGYPKSGTWGDYIELSIPQPRRYNTGKLVCNRTLDRHCPQSWVVLGRSSASDQHEKMTHATADVSISSSDNDEVIFPLSGVFNHTTIIVLFTRSGEADYHFRIHELDFYYS